MDGNDTFQYRFWVSAEHNESLCNEYAGSNSTIHHHFSSASYCWLLYRPFGKYKLQLTSPISHISHRFNPISWKGLFLPWKVVFSDTNNGYNGLASIANGFFLNVMVILLLIFRIQRMFLMKSELRFYTMFTYLPPLLLVVAQWLYCCKHHSLLVSTVVVSFHPTFIQSRYTSKSFVWLLSYL